MPIKSKEVHTSEQEVVYQFQVLLDGNEKFIWLQAAAELGRLSPESALSFHNWKKIGLGRPNVGRMALKYAEWATLVSKNETVSGFFFDVHDKDSKPEPHDNDDVTDVSSQYDSTRLLSLKPKYAYKSRKMTERDLYNEMMATSEKWEDLRKQAVGDREEEVIGSLHVEVLSSHGLSKLDRLSGTDAVCYFVCGPYAFTSDVINGFCSPVWPRKSRRAAIFPLFHAYQRLYVGIFDDDGAQDKDDFIGRVVIDMARLRPNSVYDISLPLRLYQNVYVKKAHGSIRLRLRVEYYNERKALLSYLKLPKKTDLLGNSVTVNCSDFKAFRNVVMTVQGKDLPGRFNVKVQKALQREAKLYKEAMQATMKAIVLDIVHYAHPINSLCVFFVWTHIVYLGSVAYVPVYLVAGIITFLMRNYVKYGEGGDSELPDFFSSYIKNGVTGDPHFGFSPVKLSELLSVLLYGGSGTSHMKPIKVVALRPGHFQMDHMEFPFSEGDRYPKSYEEATGDDDALDDDEDVDPEPKTSRKFGRRKKKNSSSTSELTPGDEEIEDEEEEDCVLNNDLSNSDEPSDLEVSDPPWKRVKNPLGLPEQDASVAVKATKTLKEEILHNKHLLQTKSMRLFDDRMFIVDKHDPEHSTSMDLNQAIGATTYSNPLMATIAEYAGPGLECLKVPLSMWRAIFNLFLWRDPFLTTLFFVGNILLLSVLLVFPWRLFFFVVGFGAFGPQVSHTIM